MQVDTTRVEEIFGEAVGLADDASRAAYLDQACGNDADLRARVEALLTAHVATGNLLKLPESDMTVAFPPLSEGPGTKIGRYKLLEQIGEGGFGVVFMAEQEEPVRRRVALKIIKLGMDTRQVVARFEAERQALAMMDHPNIAKVLDGGSTDTGRPYFVMELVAGIPITKYCDENKLPTVDRLKLFVAVCSAVQHAHQKGIIHRDIKPTNVLVTMHDDRPVPKIIDFGIAKATQARLTEKTLFTEFRQMIGTPAYMSPEQAQMSGIDVDTRSDIYSLGVLLYELLTGTTPIASKELLSAGYAEMQRLIQEVEPPPPSTRLVDSQDSLPSIAAQRQTEPAKLAKSMRGDLDWIVMRCLEKDRTRRYETATGLAQDVERYLTDEPVEARRPTRLYRLKKFVRRNKVGVLTGTAIVAALAVGLVATSYFAATASREAKNAKAALEQAEISRKNADGVNKFFTEEVFGLADPNHYDRAGITLVEALDVAAGKIDSSFPDDSALRAEIRERFGEIYSGIDQPSSAIKQLRQAVELRRSLAGDLDPATMKCRAALGSALFLASHWKESRDVLESVWADQTKVLGEGSAEATETACALAVVCMESRGGYWSWSALPPQNDRDLEVTRKAYDAALVRLGPRHIATLNIENELGWALRWRGKSDEGIRYAKEAADGLRDIKGSDDVVTLFARYNYAACLVDLKRYDDGIAEFREVLAARNRKLGPTHLDTLCTAWSLAANLIRGGETAAALQTIEDIHANLSEIKKLKTPLRANKILDFSTSCGLIKEFQLGSEFLSAADDMASVAPDDENQHRMYAKLLIDIARQMITFPEPSMRNAPRAVELATKACELTDYKNAGFVGSLAAAYEAAGDKEAAAKTREKLKALQAEHPAAER